MSRRLKLLDDGVTWLVPDSDLEVVEDMHRGGFFGVFRGEEMVEGPYSTYREARRVALDIRDESPVPVPREDEAQ